MRGWTYVPGRREDDFHVLRLIERKDGMLDLGLTQGFQHCIMPLSTEQAREIGETLIRWAETGRLEKETFREAWEKAKKEAWEE